MTVGKSFYKWTLAAILVETESLLCNAVWAILHLHLHISRVPLLFLPIDVIVIISERSLEDYLEQEER